MTRDNRAWRKLESDIGVQVQSDGTPVPRDKTVAADLETVDSEELEAAGEIYDSLMRRRVESGEISTPDPPGAKA